MDHPAANPILCLQNLDEAKRASSTREGRPQVYSPRNCFNQFKINCKTVGSIENFEASFSSRKQWRNSVQWEGVRAEPGDTCCLVMYFCRTCIHTPRTTGSALDESNAINATNARDKVSATLQADHPHLTIAADVVRTTPRKCCQRRAQFPCSDRNNSHKKRTRRDGEPNLIGMVNKWPATSQEENSCFTLTTFRTLSDEIASRQGVTMR